MQKYFTRKISIRCNVPLSSYVDRLSKLNLESLEYLRLKFDLIFIYKICYHLVDVKFDEFFQCSEISYKLRSHRFVLRCKRRPQCDAYRYFFSYRIISDWNLLPKSVVSSSTLAASKTRLRILDLHDVCHLTY